MVESIKKPAKKTVKKVPAVPEGKASGTNNWHIFIDMPESEADVRFAAAIKKYPDLPQKADRMELAVTHADRWYPVSRRIRRLAEALDECIDNASKARHVAADVAARYGYNSGNVVSLGVVALCFLGAPYRGATDLISGLAKRQGTKHHKGSWPATSAAGGSKGRDADLDDILGNGF